MCDAGRRKHQQLVWTHYEIKFVNRLVQCQTQKSSLSYCIFFLVHRRTGEERPTSLDVANDRHAYPPLIFSRVKSYTVSSEQPLK